MKKTAVLILVLILALSSTACGSAQKTSDDFDDSIVKEKAENVISLLNSSDYASVEYMVKEEVRDKLTAQVLEDALGPILEEAGEFVKFDAEQVTGSTGNGTESYATAVIKAEYENRTFIYTITFDSDYRVAGLYIK